MVVGEKESTQMRQARELLERFTNGNSNGGNNVARDSNENSKKRRKSSSPNSRNRTTPQKKTAPSPPRGPQPKKTPKCAICLDEIEKPTATKCGHVYCEECIRELIRAQKTKSRCPQCRKKVGLSGLTKLILDD
jgi:hypothetical protein